MAYRYASYIKQPFINCVVYFNLLGPLVCIAYFTQKSERSLIKHSPPFQLLFYVTSVLESNIFQPPLILT